MARATGPILFGLRALTSTTHTRSSCCRLSTASILGCINVERPDDCADRSTFNQSQGLETSVLPRCPVFVVVLALNLLAGMILFAIHLLGQLTAIGLTICLYLLVDALLLV